MTTTWYASQQNHGAHSAVSSNAETSTKYQLSTAWWNDGLYAVMTSFA